MSRSWYASLLLLTFLNWHCRRAVGDLPFEDGSSATNRGPNIIFLLADDLRFDALGYTGNPFAITPNIDSLAAEGTNFKNAYVTSAICAISRASILTGQYASRHGINDFNKSLSYQALRASYPSLLRESGYYTGFIGKYGIGNMLPARAFDYWKGYSGHGSYFYNDADGNKVHETAMMEKQAVEFIESRDASRPFCLSISFKAPHSEDGVTDNNGFRPDPIFNSWYNDVTFPLPETYNDYYQFPKQWRTSAQNSQNEGRKRWNRRFSPEKFQTTAHAIYRLVSGIDKAVGDLRAYLKTKGLDDNTIIIFSSDNGYYMGEHGLEGKWYGHEESIRVPLIVYDPRIPRQRTIADEMVLNIDFAPTMLSLAGLPAPAGMQGKSLQSLLTAPRPNWRSHFFYEHPYDAGNSFYIPKTVGVVTPSWKYMMYYNGKSTDKQVVYEELFDVSTDANEKNNLINDPAQASRVVQLKNKLAESERSCK